MRGKKRASSTTFFHIYMHRGFFRVGRRPKLSAIIDAQPYNAPRLISICYTLSYVNLICRRCHGNRSEVATVVM
jgi:hypothetical protein